jgi:hypothetical protein
MDGVRGAAALRLRAAVLPWLRTLVRREPAAAFESAASKGKMSRSQGQAKALDGPGSEE